MPIKTGNIVSDFISRNIIMARVRKVMHAYVVPYHTKLQNEHLYNQINNISGRTYNHFFDLLKSKCGRVLCLERPVLIKENEQLLHQVVELEQLDEVTCAITIQGSLMSPLFNIETVNKFTCAESYCCTQLFKRYLYRTRLKFVFAKLLDRTPQKIHLVGHTHAPNGVVHILFELIDP